MIDLDYNATTPLDPEVAALMAHVATHVPGNAASIQHGVGSDAAQVVERARHQVGRVLDVSPNSIVWTSGATEGLHLAIVGLVGAAPLHKRTIVIGATEHKAAFASAEFCRRLLGAELRVATPTTDGQVLASTVESLIDDSVCAVVCMHSNNETGVVNPIADVSDICRARRIPLICDLTQSIGKWDLTSVFDACDLATFSAHKFYGPKGTGVLIADSHTRRRMVAALAGGGQESGLRGGTVNTPGVAAMALAVELAVSRVDSATAHYQRLSMGLISALTAQLNGLEVIGVDAPRIPNTQNVRFRGADAEAVMANMPQLAVSTGSACNAAVSGPSHVLLSMGMDSQSASECIRFSFGLPTSMGDVNAAAGQIVSAVERVRRLNAA